MKEEFGFQDSKKLDEEERENIFHEMKKDENKSKI